MLRMKNIEIMYTNYLMLLLFYSINKVNIKNPKPLDGVYVLGQAILFFIVHYSPI